MFFTKPSVRPLVYLLTGTKCQALSLTISLTYSLTYASIYNKKNIYIYSTAISEKQEFKCNKNYRYVKKKILIKLRLTSKIY